MPQSWGTETKTTLITTTIKEAAAVEVVVVF